VTKLLDGYQQPEMDPGTAEALADYVARKKASMPDSFM
jgi:trimethylamine--corrinoid protein Co-methyltransferase